MHGWPEESCLMCDMPWKNNYVLYEGGPPPPQPPDGEKSAEMLLGSIVIQAYENGEIRLEDKQAGKRFATKMGIQKGTMAADAATRTLYFSAGKYVCAMDLTDGSIRWRFSLDHKACSPMLYEWLNEDGSVRVALGVCDVQGGVFAVDRETGKALWKTETGFATAYVPVHRDGRLFISLEGLAACLDAQSGDAIWACEAGGGQGFVTEQGFLMGAELFSVEDGHRLR